MAGNKLKGKGGNMTGNRGKGKGKGKPKPKSVKAKAVNLSSKRRLSRLGKEQQRGKAGIAAHYVSRNKAMKMLQVTLRDFRRLCILKGIYPRDPKKKPNKDKNKTYYHLKDISYLMHEPLLEKFRTFKTFMKKVRKKMAKKAHQDAIRMYDKKPEYSLDHLVRERYPRFADSLEDLDDGLCLMHLFANLPSIGSIRVERTDAALRFCREWQLFVAKSRSLRKVFVSVKGIYYQAEVQGVNVTWLVPHKFSQNLPTDVDYRVMLTFLEFYETLLGFVMYKLYHNIGLRYPPKLITSKDTGGAHLSAIQIQAQGSNNNETDAMEVESNDVDEAAEIKNTRQQKKKKTAEEIETEKKLKTLNKTLKKIAAEEVEEKDGEEGEEKEESEPEEEKVFAGDEGQKAILENHEKIEALTNLFHGKKFWISREVPFETLEFCITAFGGKVMTSALGFDEKDDSITHQVTDRDIIRNKVKSREYIQPQWVFDCINAKLVLPVARYAPDAKDLPPHLSPFVDDAAEGYAPLYAEEIQKLRAARDANTGTSGLKLLTKEESLKQRKKTFETLTKQSRGDEGEMSDESSDESSDEEAEENTYAKELQAEKTAEKKAEKKTSKMNVEFSDDEDSEDSEDSEADEEEEEEEEEAKQEEKTEKVVKEKKKTADRFIPSKKYKGSKKGYVFRMGKQGVGYYLDLNKNQPITFRKSGGGGMSKRQKRIAQKKEEEEMRHMMMTKKAKRLYGRMQHGINKKKEQVDKLKRKRHAHETRSKKQKKRN